LVYEGPEKTANYDANKKYNTPFNLVFCGDKLDSLEISSEGLSSQSLASTDN